MKRILLRFLIISSSLFSAAIVHAQSVGINGTGSAPNPSAMLDVSSTTSGMLIPRMIENQRNAIASPATGLLIYQTDDTTGFYYFNGTIWQLIGSGTGWGLSGNSGTIPGTNFIGTTDANDFVFKTNSSEKMRLENSSGNLILGSGDGTGTAIGNTLRAPYSSGTNTTGANLTITSGDGTGIGGSGYVSIQTAPIGATGSVANTVTEAIRIANTGNIIIGSGEAGIAPTGNTLRAPNGSGTNIKGADLTITSGNGTGTGGSGRIIFQTASTIVTGAITDTMTERMRIAPTGNVGIGTTNPLSLLHVNGTETLGTSGGGTTPATGTLTFNNSSSANSVSISAGNTTASYSLTLPTGQGAANTVLTNNGSGALTWTTPNSTLATSNVTTSTGGVTIVNGTGQVVGGSNLAINISANSSTSQGLVPAGSGNNNKAWVTDGSGNPSWRGVDLTAAVTNILPIANGGTNLSTPPTNGQLLIGNGIGYTLGTITAGTGISVTNAAGSITVANTGVTSVGLVLPGIFTVTNSPVTTTGTLTGTLANETANTIFAGPVSGGAATPAFRALVPADIPASSVTANSGVNVNTGNNIQLGGTLMQTTTITQANYDLISNMNGTGNFRVQKSGTDELVVNSTTGNVGIGNSTPAQALDVAGNITFSQALMPNGLAGTAGNILLSAGASIPPTWLPSGLDGQVLGTNAGVPTWGTISLSGTVITANNGINFNTASNVQLGGSLVQATTITQGNYDLISNMSGTGNFRVQAAGSDVFGVYSATGNVAIGTTNPLSLLHVNGTETLGTPGGGTTPATGILTFNNSGSANSVSISAGNTTTSYSLTLPIAQGANNTVLTNNGSGVLTWSLPASLLNLTPGTGLTGAVYNGSTARTFAVNYGSTAGSAVQGNTTLTIAAGTGMNGGGTITLGTGGTVTLNNTGVTSVGLALPSIFTVTNSPVTTTGTLTGTLANENANTVFAGPDSGGATTPTFRVLVPADIPVGTVTADNGLTVNSGNNVQLGGALVQNTTITQGNYDLISNMTGTGNFRVQKSGTDELVVNNATGNVGIGTNTPAQALDVAGNVTFSQALMPNGIAGTAGNILLSAGASTPPTWLPAGFDGQVLSTNAGVPTWGTISASVITANNGINFSTATNLQLGGSLVQATTITQGNYDLISNMSGTGNFRVQAAGSDVFGVYSATGNVAIGTTNPLSLLHVNGTETLGTPSGGTTPATGTLIFNDSSSTNSINISAGNTTTGYSLTLPTAQGANNTVLTNNGSGTLTWALPSASLLNLTPGTGLTGSAYNGSAVQTFAVNYGSTAGTSVQGNTTLTVTPGTGMSGGGTITLGTGGTVTLNNTGVTSVGLALPNIFTVTNSPVTTTGTLTGTLATETANTVFAGPTSGVAATPTFRALVAADIPTGTVTANNGLSISAGNNVQLGGANALLANTSIISGGFNLSFTGTGALQLGAASTSTGTLKFFNSTNANAIGISSGATTTAYNLTLPLAQGAANTVLTNNGSGALTWALPSASLSTLTPGTGLTGSAYNGSVAQTFAVNYGSTAGSSVQGNTTLTVTPGTGMSGGGTITLGTGGTLTLNNTGVTSVGLSLPNIFTVTNSPVTSTGTLTGTLTTQSANTVFAAPNGSGGTPTFRALVAADVPAGTVTANNGLTVNTGNNVQLGGSLIQNTTITQGNYNLISNMSGTGDFIVQNNGSNALEAMSSTGNVVIGSGEATGTVAGNTLRAPNATGSNISGANFTLTSGDGTGTGGSGSIIFQTAPVGATGSTVNTMTERMRLTATGALAFNGAANYGTSGSMLQSTGNAAPAWSTATYPTTTTNNQLLYSSATNTVTGLGTVDDGVLTTSASGVPTWLSAGTNGYVLTMVGGVPAWASVGSGYVTNVTASSPLSSSGGTTPNISLTGIVPVANGGTGDNTLTQNGVLYGNGTSAVGVTGTGTQTEVLTNNSSGQPTWSAAGSSGGLLSVSSSGTLSWISAGNVGEVLTPTYSGPPVWSTQGTSGEIMSISTSGLVQWSPAGATGQVLTVNTSNQPTWTATGTAGQILSIASSGGVTWTPAGSNGAILSANYSGIPTWISGGTNGQVLTINSSGTAVWAAPSSGVTSVGLSLPSIFTVTNSPVTSTGTLTGTFTNENANTVFAGPSSGGSATPTFRALVAADIPSGIVTANNGLTVNTGNNVQLGGTLAAATTIASDGFNLSFTGTGAFQLGAASASTGTLKFYNSTNANAIGISAGATTTAYNLTLPLAQGAANTVLTNNGSGTLTWAIPTSSAWNLTGNAGTTAGINFVGTTDANDLVFKTGGTEDMRIDNATGNVVIGSGDATGTVAANALRGPAITGTNKAGVNLTIESGNGTGTGGSGNLIFQTASTGTTGTIANTMSERMRISTAGYVGIGTTTPASLLHVNGTETLGTVSSATGTLTFNNSSSSKSVSISAGNTTTAYSLTLPTAAPTSNGQVLSSTTGGTMSWATPPSTLLGIICDTTAGTTTPTLAAGTTYILVKCIGGGGAGGGLGKSTCTHGTDEAGSGGGAGAYCEGFVTGISVGTTTISVTVGAGGAGAAGCNAVAANNGTASSVTLTSPAATFTAGGGYGGSTFEVTTTATNLAGGKGGTASGGSINIPGANGGNAICSVTGTDVVFAGEGASSMFGNGGQQQYTRDQEEYVGLSARAPGAGGGGAVAVQQTSNIATSGGSGSHGIVIIYEY